jgi:hypothetical protein
MSDPQSPAELPRSPDPSPVPPDPVPAAPKKRRSLLGWLFKSVLGCTALITGALLMGIVLLPRMLSPVFPDLASKWFGSHYRGQLTLKRAQLAWTGEQTFEGLVLLDPSGKQVATLDARVPGILDLIDGGGSRIGHVSVECAAVLEAADDGTTNLDRALEPRKAPAPPTSEPSDSTGIRERLEELDLSLDLLCTRLSWSDARTRALGKPFELRSVRTTAQLSPHRPIEIQIAGDLEGEKIGKLDLMARIENAFAAPASATPPRLFLDAQIDGFATALIDGLAGMGGRLTAGIGPTFRLSAKGQGTTSEGELRLDFESEHALVTFGGELASGVLRSNAGGGLELSIDSQPEWIEPWLATMLPPGKRLVPGAPGAAKDRLVVRVKELELPLGAYLDAQAAHASDALQVLVRGTKARATVALGAWRYSDASAPERAPERAPELAIELRSVEARAELEPGSSATLALGAEVGPKPGRLDLTAQTGDLAALVALLPLTSGAELAPLQLDCRLTGVSTQLASAFVPGTAELSQTLAQVLGPSANARLECHLALAAVPGAHPTDLARALADWRALGRRLSGTATLTLDGTPAGVPIASAGGEPLGLKHLQTRATLEPDKPVALDAQADFVSRRLGNLALTAQLGQLFQEPSANLPLELGGELTVADFPMAIVDALAGQGGRLTQLAGDSLEVRGSGHGTVSAGELRLDLYTERSEVKVFGRFRDGLFTSGDEPALRLLVQPDDAWFDAVVRPLLPSGIALRLEESRGALGLNVNFLALPVRELFARRAQGTDALLDTLLSRTRIEAVLDLRALHYEDAKLVAAKLSLENVALTLALDAKPGETGTPVSLDLELGSPSLGATGVKVHARAQDAKQLRAALDGGDFAPVELNVEARGLPARLVDAWSGDGQRATALLGSAFDLLAKTKLEQAAGQALAAHLDLDLAARAGATKLALDARIEHPLAARAAGTLPALELELDLDGSETLLAALPAEHAATVRELLGTKAHASARHTLTKEAGGKGLGDLSAQLRSEGLELSVAGAVESDVFVASGNQRVSAKLAKTGGLLRQFVAAKMPAGSRLDVPEDAGAVSIELSNVRLPLAQWLGPAAPPASAAPAPFLPPWIAEVTAHVAVALPTVVYTHPAPAPVPGAPPTAAPPAVETPVRLHGVALAADLERGKPWTAHLTGSVDATPPGAIDVQVVATDPAHLDPSGAGPGNVAIEGKLSRVPTAILDALSRQDGLLVDVLGPELEAQISGAWPNGGQKPLRASLDSKLGHVQLVGRIEQGKLTAVAEEGLDAQVGLTPLFSDRIVGKLVPLLLNLSKPAEAGPAGVSARAFSLPLNGDLSQLSGQVVLDLGQVNYQLLPGLTPLLKGLGSAAPKTTQLPPITIRIESGIAKYDSLPLQIGGNEYVFKGTYDLARAEFKLATQIPLSVLGSGIEKDLEKVRDLLDPQMLVPVEISGTWSKPRLRLGKDFLDKVVKKAAENALKKGLGDLLGGEKKKKDE